VIFFLVSSCSKEKIVLHSYNVKGQYFNRYKVVKVDKNKCELELEDLPPIDADDESLDGAVLVTKKDFARLQADAKTECENDKQNLKAP
jgi:hypothetical protein